jgi:predicted glycogen debranching enzyme
MAPYRSHAWGVIGFKLPVKYSVSMGRIIMANANDRLEWLEADGLGGFASGTVSGVRTRRYHALLLAATTPPTGRCVLINGFDAWLETDGGSFPLSSQLYGPDVVHPDGARRLASFELTPWPKWTYTCEDGSIVEQELFVPKGSAAACLSWRLAKPGPGRAVLNVRPFMSGRDYHSLHHRNADFRFEPLREGRALVFRPYAGLPGVRVLTSGAYEHKPEWYGNFLYDEERARGLECGEDLASPGVFTFDLTDGEAVWIVAAEGLGDELPDAAPVNCLPRLRSSERRRRAALPTRLDRAADDYIVKRDAGKTIVAGYPWFTDWGRDTFISMRGLCLATGRLDVARDILVGWADAVSEGMLPNLFPDGKAAPEYNAVDASLWYVIAVHDYFEAIAAAGKKVAALDRKALEQAVAAILDGYASGTRFGIHADADGLLAAGVPGAQLTWMDAKIGDWVVTPRIGKPVEVQALWLNALRIGGRFSPRWSELHDKGVAAFRSRFWNESGGYLYDVVDVEHATGATDGTFRPNQIFAVGGLPFPVLEGERARRVVDEVERRLLTPLGPRSLAPDEHDYTSRYEGGPRERDGSYHQGTVWPWLMGGFVEAWVRVRGGGVEARREARARFLDPLLDHLDAAGLGHLPEIADAEAPHTPRGCPFQAWSIGEALRLDRIVLAEPVKRGASRKSPARSATMVAASLLTGSPETLR